MLDTLTSILMGFGVIAGFLWIIMIASMAIYYIHHFWWKIKKEDQKRRAWLKLNKDD